MKAIFALGAALLVVGCGGATRTVTAKPNLKQQAVTAVRYYQQSVLDDDPLTYCGLMDDNARQAFTVHSGIPNDCMGSFRRVSAAFSKNDRLKLASEQPPGTGDVTVHGIRATVHLHSGHTLPLVRIADRWMVDGLPR